MKPNYDERQLSCRSRYRPPWSFTKEDNSLQTIADTLSLNPIKVRKLLITAGVYESEIADVVNASFEEKQGMSYKRSIRSGGCRTEFVKGIGDFLFTLSREACISEKTVAGADQRCGRGASTNAAEEESS